MIEHIKNIFRKSIDENYAVGAFNVHNLEGIIAVSQAAEEMKSPAIIQVSPGAAKYIGLKNVADLVKNSAEKFAPNTPLALHLDHGKDYDFVLACIKNGFSSVHMDGSHLPLDENIAITKKVVEIAHKKDIWVQGEVGAMVGGHGVSGDELEVIPVAKPEEVIHFVKETGVDTIAAAIGTAHGIYKNEDVRMDLLKEIKKGTDTPFILHGGSGVDEKKIKESSKNGVNAINIGSEIKIAFSEALIKNCIINQKETDPRKLLRPTIAAIKKVVIEQMKIFNSINRV